VEEKGKIEKQFEKWEKIRSRSKWRYYFIYGSLLWGGIVSILLTIWDIARSEFDLKYAVLRFILFLVFGLFFGKMQWKSREEFYQRYKDL